MSQSPRFTIVIPARDEERYLPSCLESISEAAKKAGVQFETIVVLNRCTDRTEAIAREFSAKIVNDDSKNLASIRNSGIRSALGEIVATIDADSRMSPGMLKEIDRVMLGGKTIGGGVLMLPERYSLGIIATYLFLLPIALCHRISGGLFFFKKSDFDAIGGFNTELYSAEDIDFAKRLKALGKSQGMRFRTIIKARIVTSCRKFDRFGDWYFVLRPINFMKLLSGRDQTLADKVWYDFKR